jgi:UDP-2,4-diacetamido-2,4,6-trideoxy-beta-L-altropyranose hydrolase
MLCSVLAAVLQRRGHDVHFAMRTMVPLVEERLRQCGFGCRKLDARARVADELPELTSIIRGDNVAATVVDHYEATAAYFAGLRATGALLGAVDDLGDRDLRALDWLLNQNLDADCLTYQTRPDGIRLLGPRYCLVRPQFRATRERCKRTFTVTDANVLITLGGSDVLPLAEAVLASLNEVNRPLRLRLILSGSPGAPQGPNVSRHELEILHNVANMADHMAWADVAVNAGGSTCWELCCLGVPMVVHVLSRDQTLVAAALEKAGVCKRVEGKQPGVAKLVDQLLLDAAGRAAMSARAMALVDGLGAERAADSLEDSLG